MAMTYGNVYVARVAMGANDAQTLRAFLEAEAYDGPSLIIAYSHCIAHGFDMAHGLEQQKAAVAVRPLAALPLQPAPARRGQEPAAARLEGADACPLEQYVYNETRYSMLAQSDPGRPRTAARGRPQSRRPRAAGSLYEQLAAMPAGGADEDDHAT